MSKSLVTLCIVFSLFYFTSARLQETYKQITEELGNLTKMFGREMECNSTLVPKIETKNVSVAVVSCKAVESLKSVCHKERKHLKTLQHYLTFVKSFRGNQTVVKCDVSEEEEDIVTFFRSLRKYFQFRIYNNKP